MPSSLAWLDHDPAARERSLRILALFQERESRDELGIGAIRDAISDRLFPGTSTVQTRLRYMLIVPWIYRALEDRGTPAREFRAAAQKMEKATVRPLLESGEEGVFGRMAGSGLKRLPSSVYWSGLEVWGIRRFHGSQDEYFRAIDRIYARRKVDRRRHDEDSDPDPKSWTFHPRLPEPPEGFPERLDLSLTQVEASFLQDCIARHCGKSLLAWLATHDLDAALESTEEPWYHPRSRQFPEDIRRLLEHARLFSDLIQGGARVYNLLLAEKAERDALIDEHRSEIDAWAERVGFDELARWDLDELWAEVLGHGHTISASTQRFVETLRAVVCIARHALAEDDRARDLVKQRETTLKGVRSRFGSQEALRQWGGRSGVRRITFRWDTARRFLLDLHSGLAGS